MSELKSIHLKNTKPYKFLQGLHYLGEQAQEKIAANPAYGKEWTGILCQLGTQEILIGMNDISRIIPVTDVTRLPGAKPWLSGLLNIQGRLLVVIDLYRFLTGKALQENYGEQGKILVSEVSGIEAGFQVSHVVGMKHYWENERRVAEITMQKHLGKWCNVQYGEADEAKPVLDLQRLMSSQEFALAI